MRVVLEKLAQRVLLENSRRLALGFVSLAPISRRRMLLLETGQTASATRDTQDLLQDLVVNALLENTTTKLVGNVLIVQQAHTSQTQRRPWLVHAWRATLENTAGNAGCTWSQRALNALPIRIVLQQVQTF